MLQPSSSSASTPKQDNILVTAIGYTFFLIAFVALFLYLFVLKPTPKPICYIKENSPSGEIWSYTHSIDDAFDLSQCIEETLVPAEVVSRAKKSAQVLADQEKQDSVTRIATTTNLTFGFLIVPAIFIVQKILKRRKNLQKEVDEKHL